MQLGRVKDSVAFFRLMGHDTSLLQGGLCLSTVTRHPPGCTSSYLTQRPSSADLPAAMAMISAISPSSPEQGDGLSLTRQSQKAMVSWMYACHMSRTEVGGSISTLLLNQDET